MCLPCNVVAPSTTSQQSLHPSQVSLSSRIIAAESALRHIQQKGAEITKIMSPAKPQIDYVLLAGFNETLIQRSVGHLEEIHLYVNTSFPSHSPIFDLLGKAFSPFFGAVWMPDRSQPTPVFNEAASRKLTIQCLDMYSWTWG